MEEWSLDVINDYCRELFNGDFLCEIAEGKGRIMIAKKDVKQGDLIFTEPPLHIATEDEDNDAFTTLKELCENDSDTFDYEPLWYWAALSSLTKEQIGKGPNVGELEPVSEAQQRQLLCLFHEPVEEASDAVREIIETLGLTVKAEIVEELLQAWILNCFEHAEDPLAYSAYFASSFISHSCGANAIWTEGENALHVLRAREPISAGDEITISYLNEQELLHCAEARIKSLQDTKQFICTCRRCSPPPSSKNDEDAKPFLDHCRGFTCPSCGACGLFYRLDKCTVAKKKGKGKTKGSGKSNGVPFGMDSAECQFCKKTIDEKTAAALLEAEEELEEQVDAIDAELKDGKPIAQVMAAAEYQELILQMQTGGFVVGPQHWMTDRLWEHMANWFNATNQRSEQRKMMELRANFQRKAYDGLSGALAWTLEEEGDTVLRHIGFGQKVLPQDAPVVDELAKQVPLIFEESLRILTLMFGKDHEYATQVERKCETTKKFLQRLKEKGADTAGYT